LPTTAAFLVIKSETDKPFDGVGRASPDPAGEAHSSSRFPYFLAGFGGGDLPGQEMDTKGRANGNGGE